MSQSLADNPILNWTERPVYTDIKAEHVVPAIESALAEAEKALSDLEQDPPSTWLGLFPRIEKIQDDIGRFWGVISHLNGVRNSPELRDAYTQAQPQIIAFINRSGQSQAIYDSMLAIQANEGDQLDETQTRILEASLRAAHMSGIGLSGADRDKFNENSRKLAELSTQYSNNLLDATKAYRHTLTTTDEVAGLPPSFLAMAAENARQQGHENATAEDGPWAITLDSPSYLAIQKYSDRRELREEVYRAYTTRASAGDVDNKPIVNQIMPLRQEQAKLLGFENYAQMSLAGKMAGTVEAVETLLLDLRQAARQAGADDIEALRTLARESGAPEAADLQFWDYYYWSEKLRTQKYALNDEELRPYFPLPRVLEGMYELVGRIFGIVIKQADGQVPVWHPDVQYFNVLDQDGTHIADFYLDPYSRPSEKRGGAWADVLVQRSKLMAESGKEVRIPAGYMCCNQSPPVDGKPSLMTFQEVLTMYHEFGHQLQNVLTTIDSGLVSGLRGIEWDAIELASQFMENWCYHRPTLESMARHYETGDPLPEELVNKIIGSRTYQAGYMMLRQVNFGIFDITLHKVEEISENTALEIQQQVATETLPLPLVPEDRFFCGFGHIFSGGAYAAGYYSYKWAEVLSADAFAAFTEIGLDNVTEVQKLGRRFRDTVLALGGSKHPMDVFIDFRGRKPEPAALLRQEGLI